MFNDPPHIKINIVTRAAKQSLIDCYKWDSRTREYSRHLRCKDHLCKHLKTMREWSKNYKDQGFTVECFIDWQLQQQQ